MRFTPAIVTLLISTSAFAQQFSVKNTYEVLKSDSKNDIILKAAHVVPTSAQYEAQKREFIAFVHFGPNTFTDKEWGNGFESPEVFNPTKLNTDQWCAAMKAAGMKKVILTAKHHDGFVLWQSRYTKHGLMSSPYKNGQGDILKDLSKSCEKYGLKLGVYLSPADLFQIESADGLYGNLSKYSDRTIPRSVAGRPFENKKTFTFNVDDYNEYFLNQLFELLTEYGPIHEVWFDGAHPKRKGDQRYNYGAWRQLIRELAPEAVIFGKEDIRWAGNEGGHTRDTEWNVIPYEEDPRTMNNYKDLTDKDLGSIEKLEKGKFLHYQPAETNTSIREGWFYRETSPQSVRSTNDVFDMYERSVGGNSIFLLNIPPNKQGLFPAEDVKVLEEVGAKIKDTYGKNLLKGAKGIKEVLDEKPETYKAFDVLNPEIVIDLQAPTKINRIAIQEAVWSHSERISKHAVDAWVGNAWKEIASATNVGYKRILRFEDVTTSKIRLRVLESRHFPAISSIEAFYAKPEAPELGFTKTADGLTTIHEAKSRFAWNKEGKELKSDAKYKIYYTLDGSEPTTKSKVYTNGLNLSKGKIKARAILADGKKGPISEARIGISKKDWKVLGVSSEQEKHETKLAFDENSTTYWSSKESDEKAFISFDLGKVYSLSSFAYTPQTRNGKGMLERGRILTSEDGKTWNEVEGFEFGNLINDPTKRTHLFKKAVQTRYIKVEASRIANDDKTMSIAEIDFFEK